MVRTRADLSPPVNGDSSSKSRRKVRWARSNRVRAYIHEIERLGFTSHITLSVEPSAPPNPHKDRLQNGPSSSESAAHSKTLTSTRASQSFTGWYSTSIEPASLCAASLSCVAVTLEVPLSAKPLASKARQDEAFLTSAHSI